MSRALVVEDNVELAQNVAEILETLDVEVTVVHDAPDALREAARGDIDLAIVDVRLPGGFSGVDLLPKLRVASPNVECVLVTGNATVDSAVAAVRHGAVAYVQKPFASRDLLAIASRALEQARLRRERERLAVELARSEALHRGVLDSVEAAILGLDHEGALVFVNHFATSLRCAPTGVELHGRSFAEIFVDDADRSVVATLLRRAEVEALRDVELPMPRRDGVVCVLRWTFTPIVDGERIRVLAVGIDVTRTRELERRTVEAEALAAVGALTSGLAHEIRNPLNAAILQLEALVRGARRITDEALRGRIEERVTIVRGELRRLTTMLDEFLGLAHPRAVELKAVDLDAVVRDVVTLDHPLGERQGVSFVVAVDDDTRSVLADEARLKQVLINLIGNALEAMRATGPGVVTLRAAVLDEGFVEVCVDDEGSGLDQPAEGLFRAFVTTKEAGTGLGLSIVKKIVELHGGRVELRARLPRGVTASFTLKRAARRV